MKPLFDPDNPVGPAIVGLLMGLVFFALCGLLFLAVSL